MRRPGVVVASSLSNSFFEILRSTVLLAWNGDDGDGDGDVAEQMRSSGNGT